MPMDRPLAAVRSEWPIGYTQPDLPSRVGEAGKGVVSVRRGDIGAIAVRYDDALLVGRGGAIPRGHFVPDVVGDQGEIPKIVGCFQGYPDIVLGEPSLIIVIAWPPYGEVGHVARGVGIVGGEHQL